MENTFSYEFINQYEGTRTPHGTVEFDLSTGYFFRSLYQRALSVINFTMPKEWNKNYFKNVLFGLGYIAIIDTAEYGIIPQMCTISGYGIYRQPTRILVSQPLVQFDGRRGDRCELVRLTPDFLGITDIIEHYALMLSQCFTSVNVSVVNSRLGMMAYAKNKQASETLKVIAEKLSSGDPLIVVDKQVKADIDGNDPIFKTAFDPAKNYITDKLLTDMETIIKDFDREIGIPSLDDKRERRIELEVNTMIADTGSRVLTWSECLKESIAEVKEVFPELELDFSTRIGDEENVIESAVNIDRNV